MVYSSILGLHFRQSRGLFKVHFLWFIWDSYWDNMASFKGFFSDIAQTVFVLNICGNDLLFSKQGPFLTSLYRSHTYCSGYCQFWSSVWAKSPKEQHFAIVDLNCLYLVYIWRCFFLSFIYWFWHNVEITIFLPSKISHLIKADKYRSFYGPFGWLIGL